jgi:hypothetical protein
MSRRRVSDEDLAQWFSMQPYSQPMSGAARAYRAGERRSVSLESKSI